MADIRIKDLATTASTTASDDFMAVDGTTNGTRKLSAATPSFATSVTVPGVAGPTATDLTLAGGSTGASLVLGQGTSGPVTVSPKGSASMQVSNGSSIGSVLLGGGSGSAELYGDGSSMILSAFGARAIQFYQNSLEKARFAPTTGNLLIGGTTDIPGSGGLKVFGTTAASSTTSGALQVAGGVGVAGALYVGGAVTSGAVTASGAGTIGGVFNGAGSGSTNNVSLGTSGGGSLFVQGYNAAFSTGQTLGLNTVAGGAVNVGNTATVTTINGTTPSTGVGTGALQVAGGIYSGAASVFIGQTSFGTAFTPIAWGVPSIDVNGTTGGLFAVYYAGTAKGYLASQTDGILLQTQSNGTARINTGGAGLTTIGNAGGGVSVQGATTFTGVVAIGNTTAAAVAAPSTHKVSILIGGVQYYLLASNI